MKSSAVSSSARSSPRAPTPCGRNIQFECLSATAWPARLKAEGIPTAIYYPKALHQQAAYRDCPTAPGGLPVSERLATEVLSLPLHPYLEAPAQARIVEAVRASL